MSPHVGAFGVGLVPGGQQVGVTYQPVTTAGETHPAGRTDGCGSRNNGVESRGGSKPGPQRQESSQVLCPLRHKTPFTQARGNPGERSSTW